MDIKDFLNGTLPMSLINTHIYIHTRVLSTAGVNVLSCGSPHGLLPISHLQLSSFEPTPPHLCKHPLRTTPYTAARHSESESIDSSCLQHISYVFSAIKAIYSFIETLITVNDLYFSS